MNVLVQFKIPIEQASSLREQFEKIQTNYDKELSDLERRLKAAPNEMTAKKFRAMKQKGKLISLPNLIRAMLAQGMERAGNYTPAKLVDLMCDVGVARGRPNEP